MLTLYHGRTSVCSLKTRLALAEKGIDFDSKLLTLRGDQFEPAYMALNPNAVVPTLVHEGRGSVRASSARQLFGFDIVHYVAACALAISSAV
jgi:glutathione S-transferase